MSVLKKKIRLAHFAAFLILRNDVLDDFSGQFFWTICLDNLFGQFVWTISFLLTVRQTFLNNYWVMIWIIFLQIFRMIFVLSKVACSVIKAFIGTVHILRKHLQGGGRLENCFFCLFSVQKMAFLAYFQYIKHDQLGGGKEVQNVPT